jgi:hypothetical protein
MGVLSMAFLLGLGGFGGLSMPSGDVDKAGIGSLVICSGTGFKVFGAEDGELVGHDPGLCLVCLPLSVEVGAASAALLLVFFLTAWTPQTDRIGAPLPAEVPPLRRRACLAVHGPRAPPRLG